MSLYLINDRATATRRGEPDEKVTIVGYGQGANVRVKFPDGEVLERHPSQLLVDTDHLTSLDLDELKGDHLVSFTHRSSPAISPVAKAVPDIKAISKIRLDVLCLLVEAALHYPNTGAAISVLISNIPKKE